MDGNGDVVAVAIVVVFSQPYNYNTQHKASPYARAYTVTLRMLTYF